MEISQPFLVEYQKQLVQALPELPEVIRNEYTVFCCLKETSEKLVLKLLSKTSGLPYILKGCHMDTMQAALLHKEYDLLSRLYSEGCHSIPRTYGLFSFNGYLYMLEQFLDGYNLYESIESGHTFTQSEVVAIGAQLC